uniref:Uncharacterized protein n=1 Tax=Anopheles coluzzii TaxID=1518534 RepID=A0A8W7P7G3_ANOCL
MLRHSATNHHFFRGINYASNNEQLPPPESTPQQHSTTPARNLNINLPENVTQGPRGPRTPTTAHNAAGNAVLRLEVELRDKHAVQGRRTANKAKPPKPPGYGVNAIKGPPPSVAGSAPLEKVRLPPFSIPKQTQTVYQGHAAGV